jgi:hypothetical protein
MRSFHLWQHLVPRLLQRALEFPEDCARRRGCMHICANRGIALGSVLLREPVAAALLHRSRRSTCHEAGGQNQESFALTGRASKASEWLRVRWGGEERSDKEKSLECSHPSRSPQPVGSWRGRASLRGQAGWAGDGLRSSRSFLDFSSGLAIKGCLLSPSAKHNNAEAHAERRRVLQSGKEVSPRAREEKSLVFLALHIALLRYDSLGSKKYGWC